MPKSECGTHCGPTRLSLMLPTHRPPPALEHLSRLNKSSYPFGKLLTRWILLGCTLLVAFWFVGPLISDLIRAPQDFSEIPHSPSHPHKRPPMKRPPPTLKEQRLWDSKNAQVRETFKHAWKGYMGRAFPSDELSSVSGAKSDRYVVVYFIYSFQNINGSHSRFNGWSVTLFDSLSTMWIMNLRDEFAEAVKNVKGQRFDSARVFFYSLSCEWSTKLINNKA